MTDRLSRHSSGLYALFLEQEASATRFARTGTGGSGSNHKMRTVIEGLPREQHAQTLNLMRAEAGTTITVTAPGPDPIATQPITIKPSLLNNWFLFKGERVRAEVRKAPTIRQRECGR